MSLFWNQVFMTVSWFSAQNCKNSSPTSFLSSKPCFPTTPRHSSSSDFNTPTLALKSPNTTKVSLWGTLSNVSCSLLLNLAFTARGALAVGAYVHNTDTKTSELSLEPPHLRCPLPIHFNLAITTLELTASHTSPPCLHAAVAFSSKRIPTPSFLVARSPLAGRGLPEWRKVQPPVAGQTSLPNHLLSCTPATDTAYLFNSPTNKSSFLSTTSDLSPITCLFWQTHTSPEHSNVRTFQLPTTKTLLFF